MLTLLSAASWSLSLPDPSKRPDLSEPTVCGGLGRIRHFRRTTSPGWPDNLLPIAPAARWLGYASPPETIRALVYQNAVCNWRCWYCFVPFNLLAGHASRSRWVTAQQLIELYRALPDEDRPRIIDLSGGQPDLVPEWTMWMIDAMAELALPSRSIYGATITSVTTTCSAIFPMTSSAASRQRRRIMGALAA